MDAGRKRPFLYVDDGYPESRDYDDNYVAIDAPEPRALPQALRRLWTRIGREPQPAPPRPATKPALA